MQKSRYLLLFFPFFCSPLWAEEVAVKPPLPSPTVSAVAIQPPPQQTTGQPVVAIAHTTPEIAADLVKMLINRVYYRLDPTTCKANNPEHTLLKSWSNKITFTAETVLIWGVLCNDALTVVPLADAKQDLQITLDLSTITYKGERFIFQSEVPTLCAQGIWCPAEEKP